MRRKVYLSLFLVGLMMSQFATAAGAESQVTLSEIGALDDHDLGITVGAVSPNGKTVLIAGAEGYVRLLSADQVGNRDLDIELFSPRNATFRDIAWHPRGTTALLVGDSGLAMRYDSSDHSITMVNNSLAVLEFQLSTVVWRPAGDFAYVTANDGTVWKFAEHTGFERLNNSGSSRITDSTCHRNYNICLLSSVNEGIAVIDQGHSMTWISGTASLTWVGIDCADPIRNDCIAFASGLRSKVIVIDTIDASKSIAETNAQDVILGSGEQFFVTRGADSTTLVGLAPLGLLRSVSPSVDDVNDEYKAYSTLLPEDVVAYDAVIAGRTLAIAWEVGYNDGFLITSYGNIIQMTPKEVAVDSSILTVVVLGAVTIAVPGVILGLIYMNSPFLQRKYELWRKKRTQNQIRK